MDEFASRTYPVQEHMKFQRGTWIVQRAGWIALAVLLLAAISGLLGGGLLSKGTATNSSMTVAFEKFERTTRLTQFTFDFSPQNSAERRLRLNRAFRDNFEFTSIQPAPSRSAAGPDGLELTFAMVPSSANQVVIRARPRTYGSVEMAARADDGAALNFRVFIYP